MHRLNGFHKDNEKILGDLELDCFFEVFDVLGFCESDLIYY